VSDVCLLPTTTKPIAMKVNYHAELIPENCYHVYNKSVTGVRMFNTEENYAFFLKKYEKYMGDYVATYAYCLIPNHFHFLIKCKTITPEIKEKIARLNTKKGNAFLADEIDYDTFIVSQFQSFFSSYSISFNKQQERTGSLFKNKFKRILIKDQEHFRFMLLYIHHNGIHHNLVKEYADWKHSSYPIYLGDVESIITKNPVLKIFENEDGITLKEAFIKFHEDNKDGLGLYPNLKKWKDSAFDFEE
jgi:putative transposase